MKEDEYSDFKIGIDDEGIDPRFQEEIENTRIEKLSNRITFISILIPCLIGVIIFLAYLDIKKRVTTVHDTGTKEVQNLSKDLETKLSELISKYKKTENTISSLQAEIKEATTAIRYIRSARKADNKKFNTSIANLEKKTKSSTDTLKNVSSELKTINANFNKKIPNFSKKVDDIYAKLNKINSDIAKLSSVKIDKKALDSALKNEQKLYDKKLDQIKRQIEKKTISIPSTKVQPKTATEPEEIIEQDISQ
jgi:chromosome segregation ATPase